MKSAYGVLGNGMANEDAANGLPPANRGVDRTPSEASASEQLRSLLRKTSRDAKVTFGAYRGIFDLERREIENFYHVVDQRIIEQNTVQASSCEFCVYYNDATSRKFRTSADFESYSETRSRFPTVFTIHLAYFLSFPGSTEPEKQEIDIVLRASESLPDTIDIIAEDDRMRISGDKIQIALGTKESQFGIISYTINHTKVSWGLDLEGHIRSQIERLLEKPTRRDKILERAAGPLNLFTTVFVGLYLVNLIIDGFFWFLYRSDGAAASDDLMRIAAGYLVNGHIAKYIVATLVVSAVFFIAFSGLVSRITRSLSKPRPSFITLNDADTKRRDAMLKLFERRWINFAGMILANLLVGLLIAFLEERLSVVIGSLFGS